jgi:hypothetical protein
MVDFGGDYQKYSDDGSGMGNIRTFPVFLPKKQR